MAEMYKYTFRNAKTGKEMEFTGTPGMVLAGYGVAVGGCAGGACLDIAAARAIGKSNTKKFWKFLGMSALLANAGANLKTIYDINNLKVSKEKLSEEETETPDFEDDVDEEEETEPTDLDPETEEK